MPKAPKKRDHLQTSSSASSDVSDDNEDATTPAWDPSQKVTPVTKKARRQKAAFISLSRNQMRTVMEAVLPLKEMLFGKLIPSATNAARKELFEQIKGDLRAAGIPIPEEPGYLRRRILDNIKRTTQKKLAQQRQSGAGGDVVVVVDWDEVDGMVSECFNLGQENPQQRSQQSVLFPPPCEPPRLMPEATSESKNAAGSTASRPLSSTSAGTVASADPLTITEDLTPPPRLISYKCESLDAADLGGTLDDQGRDEDNAAKVRVNNDHNHHHEQRRLDDDVDESEFVFVESLINQAYAISDDESGRRRRPGRSPRQAAALFSKGHDQAEEQNLLEGDEGATTTTTTSTTTATTPMRRKYTTKKFSIQQTESESKVAYYDTSKRALEVKHNADVAKMSLELKWEKQLHEQQMETGRLDKELKELDLEKRRLDIRNMTLRNDLLELEARIKWEEHELNMTIKRTQYGLTSSSIEDPC